MNFLILVSLISSKTIVEFPELENRQPDEICQLYQRLYDHEVSNCYKEGVGCQYGVHSPEDILWTGNRVNFFRNITGLNEIPLTKSQTFLNYTNQAALVMSKNHIFTHYFSNHSLECWSETAYTGGEFSNIFEASDEACTTISIPVYMQDTVVPSLGHRRWVINPPLQEVVSGVAGHYGTLLVMMDDYGPNKVDKFIAYPPPGPIPANLIYDGWSFSRNYTKAWSKEHDQMPEDTQIMMKCNDTILNIKPEFYDTPSGSYYPGIVKFMPGKVPAGTYCKVVVSSASEDIEWRYTVRSINCNNGKAENVNPDAFSGIDNGFGFAYPTPMASRTPRPTITQPPHPSETDYPTRPSPSRDPRKREVTWEPTLPSPSPSLSPLPSENVTNAPKNSHKKSSSSHKNNDDDNEESAKVLGDFNIETVYLGTSPNIVVNLNFFSTLMKKARQSFGHAIPPPDFIHSAIWVGKEGPVNDNSLGAIFVYGKYWNKHNLPTYIETDGAKAFVMTLGEFKQRYPSIDPIKLNVHRHISLFEFIEKVKESGHWGARDYNWPTNNCQHFTSKLINILKATRETPDHKDWVNLPKLILNSLETNENFLEK
ncbi:hypothetical protein M9Y10_016104 [Tritrichomonas musculus]|uniref:PPPDE domain-containing protein n=1 Tax=Tritrichomonas musculus TaxID=1915356 RepID=A0ABR2I5H6_9EUKA